MRTLQITKPGTLSLTDTPSHTPGEGEVQLRIQYAGFCGSDLNTYRGRNPMVRLPVIPGHEVGAVIERVGSGVPPTLQPGATVTVNPYTACHRCPSCRRSRPNACRSNETLGVQRDGAMRELLNLPWQKVLPAPHGVTARECALIEPMSVGFHAVSRGAVSDNDTVLVIGCGMVGLGAVVRASLRGATVIATDLDDNKLAAARRMGAAHTVNSSTDDLHERLMALTGGDGPDIVIEAVGSPATYVTAVDEVAFTGRVVCIGYASQSTAFQTKLFVQKELDIRGSRNALPADFEAVMRYLERHTCPTDTLITRVVTPDEAPEAMRAWAADPAPVFRILVQMA